MTNSKNGEPSNDMTYTTASGYVLRLKPVSPLLVQKVNASIPDPKPPVYRVKGLDEEEIEFFHDETSIEDPETSVAEKAQWRQYLRDMEKANAQRREKLTRTFFAVGIDFDMPEDDSWVEEQEWLGLTVPPKEQKMERKLHFLETVALASGEDIQEVTLRLMSRTGGATPEGMEAIRNSFRRSLQGSPAGGMAAED